MGVVVAIAVVSVLLAAITWQDVANRRLVQHRHHQLQSAWLARAGVETAIAKLLSDPAYKGETIKPIESAKVKITVVPEKGKANILHITSEARFPDHESEVVVRSVTQRLQRTVQGGKVRLETVR
jgi:hypothetical protein